MTTPTTLRIYPGADGDFTFYDDNGVSQQYLRGKATWIRLRWNDHSHTLTLEPGALHNRLTGETIPLATDDPLDGKPVTEMVEKLSPELIHDTTAAR